MAALISFHPAFAALLKCGVTGSKWTNLVIFQSLFAHTLKCGMKLEWENAKPTSLAISQTVVCDGQVHMSLCLDIARWLQSRLTSIPTNSILVGKLLVFFRLSGRFYDKQTCNWRSTYNNAVESMLAQLRMVLTMILVLVSLSVVTPTDSARSFQTESLSWIKETNICGPLTGPKGITL